MSSSAKFPKHYWVNALVLLVTIPSRPVAAAQESSGAPVTPVTEVAPTEEASRPLDPLAPRRPEPEKSTPSAPRGSTFAETVVPSETEAAIILQEDAQDIEHVAEIDTREGFRIPGSYIHVAPGILSVVTTDGACMYAWGISGGSIFARHKNRVVMLGGFLDHLVGGGRPVWNHVRLGAELRLGGSRDYLFGYFLGRAGMDIEINPNLEFNGEKKRPQPRVLTTLGAGLQGLVGESRRAILGFESGVDLMWPYAIATISVRTFFGWRF